MFKVIIKLAWKNSFLRISRTLLVIIMISISMSMMLSLQGLYDGMTLNMIDSIKRSDSGEISIYAKNYRIDRDIKYNIKNSNKIKQEIKDIKGVDEVVVRLSANGLVSTARKSSFAYIYGINLFNNEKFGEFSKFLKDGNISFDNRGAIIAIELAKKLKVKIGSKIIFSTQNSKSEISSIALKVRGIIQTTNLSLDKTAIYIDSDRLHKLLSIDKNISTQIAIRSNNKDVYKILKIKYPNLEVKTFLELNPMMKQMQDLMNIFNSITFIIVMIVVFIGIFGVMFVSILDRIREFGIMFSIGMSYRYIQLQIIMESIIIALIGYILGSILGLIALWYLKVYGIDLSAFADGMQSFGMNTTLYAHIELSYFTNTFFAIIISSILSTILPFRKIKKLNPTDIIKVSK